MEMLLKTKLNNMNGRAIIKMLAVCPALVVTTTLSRALSIGLALAFVLILSEVIVSLFRKIIPLKLRTLVYIMVTAFSAAVCELLMWLLVPAAAKALGVYLPILAVSSIILMRVETVAAKNPLPPSLIDALVHSGAFIVIMLAASLPRELLGAGTLFAAPDGSGGITVFQSAPLPILCKTSGLLLMMAFFGALANYIKYKKNSKADAVSDTMGGM